MRNCDKGICQGALLAALVYLCMPGCLRAQSAVRVVHVFVALADNQYQGIVPVPAKLGRGDVPAANLYWGAAFGVKAFFRASSDWELLPPQRATNPAILERCVFKHRREQVYLVADAYQGRHIREAATDFLSAAAGLNSETLAVAEGKAGGAATEIAVAGGADLVAYVGHDAFMDFQIAPIAGEKSAKARGAMILACASKQFFRAYLRPTGAEPLLWTTGLMAPEAHTLKAALDGWMAGEDGSAIRERAAEAYDKYQHCGLRGAQRLFASGW
jgi:hypothetical protein